MATAVLPTPVGPKIAITVSALATIASNTARARTRSHRPSRRGRAWRLPGVGLRRVEGDPAPAQGAARPRPAYGHQGAGTGRAPGDAQRRHARRLAGARSPAGARGPARRPPARLPALGRARGRGGAVADGARPGRHRGRRPRPDPGD